MHKDLTRLLSPRSIAIVGASERFGAGSLSIENLRTLGFEGRIYPVNPNYTELQGLTCYPSVKAIPASEDIDCVAVLLGSQMILPVLEQAAARGVPAAWAFASGFAEVGDDGTRMQTQLKHFCEQKGILFCGPNCVGFVNLHARVCACSAPLSPFTARAHCRHRSERPRSTRAASGASTSSSFSPSRRRSISIRRGPSGRSRQNTAD